MFKPSFDNPSEGTYIAPFIHEDVDTCGGESLTKEQKNKCLQKLVDQLSEHVAMEWLREIVLDELESRKQ
tara:strand:- start:3646 stop:3855 length:210 start_codon:yes stop_codon:yes gene_type:complete